jgi:Chloroplast import apparatus Tic20-like
MTWRGSVTTADKAFSALVYLIPLLDAVMMGQSFFEYIGQFPALAPVANVLLLLVAPVILVYSLVPGGLGSIVVFFLLFFLVVRNQNVRHFLRFNTLQAILIGFIIYACGLLLGLFGSTPGFDLITSTLSNVVFLGGVATIGYAIFQSIMGRYAELPTISEAVYMQVR